MAYYFMFTKRNNGTKRNEHFRIDITTSKYFPVEPKYKTGGCTLQEIDLFTTQFNDELELRKALFKEKLITMRDFNRPLSARFYRNNTYTKVPYDFLYQKDLPYLMNPNRLIARIEKKLYKEEDYQFIIQLTNVFDDPLRYREVSSTLPEVRNCAQTSIYLGQRTRYFDTLDQNLDTLLVRMIKLIIYKHTYNKDNTINYGEINYPNFHKMLAFVNYYDKKLQEKKETEQKQLEETNYNQNNLFNEEDNKTSNQEVKTEQPKVEETKSETTENIRNTYEYHQDNLFDLIAGNRLEKYVNGEFEVTKFPSCKKRVLKPAPRNYGTQMNLFDTDK